MSYKLLIPESVQNTIIRYSIEDGAGQLQATMAWYDKIEQAIEGLRHRPSAYPLAPENSFEPGFSIHELNIGRYRVLYRIDEDKVVVLDFKRGYVGV